MTFINRYTLSLVAMLCISLFSSCTNNDNETSSSSYPSSSSNDVSSSSIQFAISSSSSNPSSSSNLIQSGIIYGDSVTYQGEIYQTVVIGNQTWLDRNLNYVVEGSVCYNNDSINCDKYGRLYDWSTAMALPDSCNSSTCFEIITTYQGICPDGWHIPNDAEWTELTNFVGANAGTKLKAKNGWSSYSGVPFGTDDYGFSALPGGICNDGYFIAVGGYGYWWSASEDDSYLADFRLMYHSLEDVYYYNDYKSLLFSVRCVKD